MCLVEKAAEIQLTKGGGTSKRKWLAQATGEVQREKRNKGKREVAMLPLRRIKGLFWQTDPSQCDLWDVTYLCACGGL